VLQRQKKLLKVLHDPSGGEFLFGNFLLKYEMQSRARRRRVSENADDCTTVITEEYHEKPKYPSNWVPKVNSVNNTSSQSQSSASSIFDIDRELLLLAEADKENQPEFIMTARDRTSEFANAIRSLQGRNIQRAVNIRDPKKAKQIQTYSDFMMVAKGIGKNIASTYTKLEKLTLCMLFLAFTFN
jgi:syntaxin 5